MSYIVARVVEQLQQRAAIDHGFAIDDIEFADREKNDLDMNLDDEILQFVLGVIDKIDELGEGEALVIYKEIF